MSNNNNEVHLPTKEFMNMHDLVMQAEFWHNKGEADVEVRALYNLIQYIEGYRDSLIPIKGKP